MTQNKNTVENVSVADVPVTDIEKIDKLIETVYKDLTGEGGRFKVNELLKAIELKRKLAPADDREKQFWSMINGIRNKSAQTPKRPDTSHDSISAK